MRTKLVGWRSVYDLEANQLSQVSPNIFVWGFFHKILSCLQLCLPVIILQKVWSVLNFVLPVCYAQIIHQILRSQGREESTNTRLYFSPKRKKSIALFGVFEQRKLIANLNTVILKKHVSHLPSSAEVNLKTRKKVVTLIVFHCNATCAFCKAKRWNRSPVNTYAVSSIQRNAAHRDSFVLWKTQKILLGVFVQNETAIQDCASNKDFQPYLLVYWFFSEELLFI